MGNSDRDLEQAYALRETGQWLQAAELAASIVADDPKSAGAWALMALVLPQLNRIGDAEKAALRAFEIDPANPVVLRAFSIIRLRQQKLGEAIALAEKAIVAAPECPHAMVTLGLARMAAQRFDEADALFQKAITSAQLAEAYANRAVLLWRRRDMAGAVAHGEAAIANKPFLTNVWQLLARLYQGAGRHADAVNALEQACRQEPNNPALLVELGETCRAGGQLDKALATLELAAARFPGYANAWANLGVAQQVAAQFDKAQASYRKALVIDSGLGDVHNNLGTLCLQSGDVRGAMLSFEQACRCFPERADLQANLGIAALRAGEWEAAFASIKCSLSIQELPQAKSAFVQCAKQLGSIPSDDETKRLVIRAMQEPWGRPGDLAIVCINMLKRDQVIAAQVGRVLLAWPARLERHDLTRENTLEAVINNPVLRCLLETVPVCDAGLEKLLTTIRKNLLDDLRTSVATVELDEFHLVFFCALARECFINSYVFEMLPDEAEHIALLRNQIAHAIESADDIPILKLIILAAYLPLHELPHAGRLLDRSWPTAVQNLLAIQVADPLKEQRLRSEIKPLTEVDDETSILVQQQYEENPYPRWTSLPATEGNVSVDNYLRQAFPLGPFCQADKVAQEVNILIAGCGTGQHSIETAQRFRISRVLAVDLSLASLGYAMRKSQELSLDNIEYAQADIMKLGEVSRRFDVIESVGVLHHLREPENGWKILANMLKPGGFMRLGLYSEKARQDIVAARRFIEVRGLESNAHDIRRCRQEIMAMPDVISIKSVTNRRDFYEMNSCRDLLFHCQEQRFALPQIKQILDTLNLTFIGFILESPAISEAYIARFPQDVAMVNLDTWDIFESENPATFKAMYQFWVQKGGQRGQGQ